jgi:AAA domain
MTAIEHGETEFRRELQVAIEKIVASKRPKKIVVAGPGAGKTSLFKTLLSESKKENPDASHLVVTFISALAEELKHDLSEFADVFTFHAYCKQLLHKNLYLREGLTERFTVFPKLASLYKERLVITTCSWSRAPLLRKVNARSGGQRRHAVFPGSLELL